MAMKTEIEKEQRAHQSMKWDEMKSGGKEKNVGQVDGTGADVEPEAPSGRHQWLGRRRWRRRGLPAVRRKSPPRSSIRRNTRAEAGTACPSPRLSVQEQAGLVEDDMAEDRNDNQRSQDPSAQRDKDRESRPGQPEPDRPRERRSEPDRPERIEPAGRHRTAAAG